MLILFIMQTHHKDKNLQKLCESLNPLVASIVAVGKTWDINNMIKDSDWYLVMFDNEFVSPDLRDAIKIIVETDPDYDYFIFMEKTWEGKVFQSPRMFRRDVRLQRDSFLPEDKTLRCERILDGWIKKWQRE